MRKGLLIPVGIIMAFWAISMSRSLAPSKPAAEERERNPDSVKPVVMKNPLPKTPEPAPGKTGSADMSRTFEYQKELNSYIDLQTKVFLTAEEKRTKGDLLHHGGLIRAMGKRLVEAARSPQSMNEQDAAIDFLLEALKSGDSGAASEVLRNVVQDRQVEEESIDRSTREQLAGLKAEVLYQWTALNPAIAGNLGAWLPGPVSQKIWSNVQRMQKSNQAESLAERH